MAQDIEIIESKITVLSEDAALESYSGSFTETQHDGTVNPPLNMAATILWQKTEAGWRVMHIHQSFMPATTADG